MKVWKSFFRRARLKTCDVVWIRHCSNRGFGSLWGAVPRLCRSTHHAWVVELPMALELKLFGLKNEIKTLSDKMSWCEVAWCGSLGLHRKWRSKQIPSSFNVVSMEPSARPITNPSAPPGGMKCNRKSQPTPNSLHERVCPVVFFVSLFVLSVGSHYGLSIALRSLSSIFLPSSIDLSVLWELFPDLLSS